MKLEDSLWLKIIEGKLKGRRKMSGSQDERMKGYRAGLEAAAEIAAKHFRKSQIVSDGGQMNWGTGEPSMGAWAYDADIAASILALMPKE